MIDGKKIVVVMPAYNAEKTLEKTYREIPKDIVDEVVVIDDHSRDRTVEVARAMGLRVLVHEQNKGYGANQKSCYREALREGADIIVMLHPDYQYPPGGISAMARLVSTDSADIVLGDRIQNGQALEGGMPVYKYLSNRVLTWIENLIMNQNISDYHTGYRTFSKTVLASLPLLENSDSFVFDNQILVQAVYFGYRIREVPVAIRYTNESSSIGLLRSILYGLGVLITCVQFSLQKLGIIHFAIFERNGNRLQG